MLSLLSAPSKALNMYVVLGMPKREPDKANKQKNCTAHKVNKSWYFKKKTMAEVYTFYLG